MPGAWRPRKPAPRARLLRWAAAPAPFDTLSKRRLGMPDRVIGVEQRVEKRSVMWERACPQP